MRVQERQYILSVFHLVQKTSRPIIKVQGCRASYLFYSPMYHQNTFIIPNCPFLFSLYLHAEYSVPSLHLQKPSCRRPLLCGSVEVGHRPIVVDLFQLEVGTALQQGILKGPEVFPVKKKKMRRKHTAYIHRPNFGDLFHLEIRLPATRYSLKSQKHFLKIMR